MDEKGIKHLKEILNILVPGNIIEFPADVDWKDNSDPAVRELIEMAELTKRLTEEERD